MKKFIFLFCLLLAGQWASAQGFDPIFEECKGQKGAMQLNLTKEMIKLGMAVRKDAAQMEVLKKVDNMKIVVVPNPDSLWQKKVTAEMEALERPDGYTKMLAASEKDKNASQLCLIRAEGVETDNPIITEFVVLASASDKGQQVLLLVQILGKFDVDDLMALGRIASHR